MNQEVTIEVERRETSGKEANGRLRRVDLIPAVVYGGQKEPISIQVPRKTLIDIFKAGGSENRIFLLKLQGTAQSRHAMIRDMQVDPITRQVSHVDFMRIDMSKRIRVKVHIALVGTAYGVKTEGGLLDFVTREIEVECLPTAIPHELQLDVTDVKIGEHLEVSSLQLPEGVTLLDAPDRVVVSVAHAKLEAEAPAATAEGAAEGAAAAEPEVMAKGKKEEEKAS
jgi:large subunit ribosomal protein L25